MSQDDSEYEEEEEDEVKDTKAFQMINKSEIPRIVKAELDELGKFLFVDEDTALLLLIHMKWNREKLNERYFENMEKLKEAAGIKASKEALKIPSDSVIDKKKKNFVCSICEETQPLSEYCSLSCNHGFCKGCLSSTLQYRLTEGSCCLETRCANLNCNLIFPLSIIRKILDAKSFARYNFFIERSFLECQKNLKLCPAPDCNWLAKRTGMSSIVDVKCVCGHSYCFQCVRALHSPVPCVYMEKWEQRINSTGLTDIWLVTNTKKCPKCKVNIEKNEGCNHMTCKNPRCGHQFCWICGGDWSIHGDRTGGFFSCNRPVQQDPSADINRTNLEYFSHYYARYTAHDASLGFAMKQLQNVGLKQKQYMVTALTKNHKSAEFIKEALELVAECRRVLRCSYVLGFYLRSGRQKDRFEFQQQYVENYTEGLTELTEKIHGGQIDRDKVVKYTAALQNFVKNIREYYSSEVLQLQDIK